MKVIVNNVGSLDGNVDAVVSVARIDGSKEVIQRPNVEIPAGGVGLISLDWPNFKWITMD